MSSGESLPPHKPEAGENQLPVPEEILNRPLYTVFRHEETHSTVEKVLLSKCLSDLLHIISEDDGPPPSYRSRSPGEVRTNTKVRDILKFTLVRHKRKSNGFYAYNETDDRVLPEVRITDTMLARIQAELKKIGVQMRVTERNRKFEKG